MKSVEAAARYVAKYMFKPSQFRADFPKHWKRVRYSQSWPQLPERASSAFVLLSRADWVQLSRDAVVIDAIGDEAYETAIYFMQGADVLINQKEEKSHDRTQSELHLDI